MENINQVVLDQGPSAPSALLARLEETLAQYNHYLKKQNAAMESLTQAIKQLDTTVKTIGSLNQGEISRLEESLITFVEYYINPRFYQQTDHKMLTNNYQIKPVRSKISHPVHSIK
jgi:hypothetical protein